MTARQRLLAAMRREEVDKVPCSPRLGVGLNILYDEPEAGLVDLALRAEAPEELDLDPHFVCDSGLPNVIDGVGAHTFGLPEVRCSLTTVDDGGCERITRTFETPAGPLREVIRRPKPGHREYGLMPNPVRLERLIKTPEDLERVRYLLPDPSRYPLLQAARELAERCGQRALVEVCIRSPLDHRAGTVYAMEDLMVDYYADRAFFDRLLNVFFEHMMAETRAVLEAGAEVIFGSWYYHSLSVGWSPAIFREVFLPQIREHVALTHAYGALYNYYDDGHVMGIADAIAEAGVDCFETLTPPPVGDADLAVLKRRIGERVCLKGYVDLLYVVKMGTPELVESTVRDAIATAGPVGFILGSSDSFREDTPRENLAAYFTAARRYGQVR